MNGWSEMENPNPLLRVFERSSTFRFRIYLTIRVSVDRWVRRASQSGNRIGMVEIRETFVSHSSEEPSQFTSERLQLQHEPFLDLHVGASIILWNEPSSKIFERT